MSTLKTTLGSVLQSPCWSTCGQLELVKLSKQSSDGWVVTVEKSPALYLYNPLTKVQISSLPPVLSFPNVEYYPDNRDEEYALLTPSGHICAYYIHAEMQQSFIHTIVLSHTTTSRNCMAAAIYGYYQLAYCRCKDQKWTAFDITKLGFKDVIFHGGKIYAVMQSGPLVVAETDYFPLEFVPVPVEFSNISEFSWKYLVGSSDGLMLVSRFLHSGPYVYKTVKFEIHKLELINGNYSWSKVTNLGDDVMLLGDNSPVMVSSRCFWRFKRNCNYYTDNIKDFHSFEKNYGVFDIGMFDIAEGRIKEFRELNLSIELVWPPPILVMPEP